VIGLCVLDKRIVRMIAWYFMELPFDVEHALLVDTVTTKADDK